MKKILALMIVCLCMSCAEEEYRGNVSIEEEIIEMNWSYAVKDLYLPEDEITDENNEGIMRLGKK
jgi:hypothetical protein